MRGTRAVSGRLTVVGAGVVLALTVWLGLGMHRGLLLSSDIRSLCFPWKPLFAVQGSGNVALADPAQQFVPWIKLARRELRAGRLPLLNPYQDGGVPLLGNAQSALGSPLTWLVLLLGVEHGWNLLLACKILLAAAGAFAWLRDLGRSRASAAVGAVSFSLSGAFVAWLAHPHTLVVAAVPWVLWAAGRVAQRPSHGRIVALAGVTWLACVGGHPEMLFLSALLVAGWTLARTGWRGLGRTMLPALAGAALAAPALVPFVEYLLISEAWHTGAGRDHLTLPWRTLARLVAPATPTGNQIETAITVSIVTLLLATGGLALGIWRRRKGEHRFRLWGLAALTAALLLVVALDNPLSNLLAHFTPVYWTRTLLLLPLPLGVLAALGLDRLQALARRRRLPAGFRRLAILAPVLALVELVAAGRGVHTVTSSAWLGMRTPLLDHVAALPRPFRVLALGHMLPPNFSTEMEIEDVRGYDALAPLGWRQQWEGVAPIRALVVRPSDMRTPGPVMSFWNVEIVLASPALRVPAPALGAAWGCELVDLYRGSDGRVLRNLSALPRARMEAGDGEVRIDEHTPTRWRLRVESKHGGTLLVANPYFPGWRARVEGQPSRLVSLPGEALRIPVPAGEHEVELVYRPVSLLAGIALALVAVVGLLLVPRMRQARTHADGGATSPPRRR